jgi:cation-transporting ATPase 13A1
MLVAFESTVVYQRVRTLTEFRSLSLKPFDIYVLRSNEWKLVKSDLLVPGDIVSIVRSGEESAVPCDVLILSGNCIVNEAMLSGESTPLLKESIRLREGQDELDLNGVDKNHTLHGGTKVLQVTNTEACPFNAPDAGSIGYVLKTGFGTSQGELVRTMVYSTERVSANNLEALLFILFLLIFAIAAAAYVWIEGTKNNLKTRYKLVLDCILIITSVVPPELPMELSLAVNNSLVALAKEYIYCTEPFRIPFAGKVDICCFDKTGTLTSENLVVEGIAGVGKKDLKELIDPKEAPKATENVLAAAHALAFIEEGGIVGDPMEKATLEAIGWRFQDDIVHSSNGQEAIKIFRRFQFSSALKRMSTISKIANTPRDQYLIAVKGAPETIQTMLTTVPQGYEEAYKYFSRRGNRVISLAYKNVNLSNVNMVEKLPREEAESGLIFAGFLIFHNPLKEDSKESIKMLNESNHRVIMITGDNALTACHVAQEVEITDREVLIIDAKPNVDNVLILKSVDETVSIEVDTTNTNKIDQSLINKHDFCMTGPAIKILENTQLFKQLLNYTWVYARVSPSQKEYILSELKHEGLTTLMCGDGTNDVGALKQAHVGIALLDATVEDLEKIAYKARIERLTKLYEQQKQMAERFNMPTPPPPPMLAQALGLPANQTAARTVNGRPAPQVDALSMSTQLLEELDDEVPTIKFGDASVASPFTSKLATIKSG